MILCQGAHFVMITAPADGLAQLGARTSAGTVFHEPIFMKFYTQLKFGSTLMRRVFTMGEFL